MTYSFNASIPQASDIPRLSQSQMLTNFSSTSGLVAVDHVGFNTANGGTHKQVTFNGNASPAAQTGFGSVLYTIPGSAKPSSPILAWKNQDQAYSLLSIRAWAFCTGAGVIVASQSQGVASISNPLPGYFTVTLNGGIVNSADFAVFVTASASNGALICFGTGSPTGVGTLEIRFFSVSGQGVVNPPGFSFSVVQV